MGRFLAQRQFEVIIQITDSPIKITKKYVTNRHKRVFESSPDLRADRHIATTNRRRMAVTMVAMIDSMT